MKLREILEQSEQFGPIARVAPREAGPLVAYKEDFLSPDRWVSVPMLLCIAGQANLLSEQEPPLFLHEGDAEFTQISREKVHGIFERLSGIGRGGINRDRQNHLNLQQDYSGSKPLNDEEISENVRAGATNINVLVGPAKEYIRPAGLARELMNLGALSQSFDLSLADTLESLVRIAPLACDTVYTRIDDPNVKESYALGLRNKALSRVLSRSVGVHAGILSALTHEDTAPLLGLTCNKISNASFNQDSLILLAPLLRRIQLHAENLSDYDMQVIFDRHATENGLLREITIADDKTPEIVWAFSIGEFKDQKAGREKADEIFGADRAGIIFMKHQKEKGVTAYVPLVQSRTMPEDRRFKTVDLSPFLEKNAAFRNGAQAKGKKRVMITADMLENEATDDVKKGGNGLMTDLAQLQTDHNPEPKQEDPIVSTPVVEKVQVDTVETLDSWELSAGEVKRRAIYYGKVEQVFKDADVQIYPGVEFEVMKEMIESVQDDLLTRAVATPSTIDNTLTSYVQLRLVNAREVDLSEEIATQEWREIAFWVYALDQTIRLQEMMGSQTDPTVWQAQEKEVSRLSIILSNLLYLRYPSANPWTKKANDYALDNPKATKRSREVDYGEFFPDWVGNLTYKRDESGLIFPKFL